VQAYVSVQQDITARVRAEQRQALLARALNATQDAVVIANEQAQILFVNCRIPDDCIDKNRYPLFMARSVLRELIESLPSTRSL
jgi:CYTH domain-containing protein